MKSKGYAAFLVIAVAVITIPAIGLFSPSQPLELSEASISENIGFQAEWTTLYADLSTSLFHQTGNEQVIMGKGGFLFFSETLSDYTARAPLPSEDIDRLAEAFLYMAKGLERQGTGLTVLIAPNKNTLYPEYMPSNIISTGQEQNLPRLNARLMELGVDVMDATALLSARKAEGLLYHPTDTHWNARGAFWVYQELASRLKALHGEPMPDYLDLLWGDIPVQGDLVRLYRPMESAPTFDYAPALTRTYTPDRPMRSVSDALIKTRCDANELKVLLAHDSFGEALFPYLANGIGRLVFSRTLPPGPALLQAEPIAHIIFEIAERSLPSLCDDTAIAQIMALGDMP